MACPRPTAAAREASAAAAAHAHRCSPGMKVRWHTRPQSREAGYGARAVCHKGPAECAAVCLHSNAVRAAGAPAQAGPSPVDPMQKQQQQQQIAIINSLLGPPHGSGHIRPLCKLCRYGRRQAAPRAVRVAGAARRLGGWAERWMGEREGQRRAVGVLQGGAGWLCKRLPATAAVVVLPTAVARAQRPGVRLQRAPPCSSHQTSQHCGTLPACRKTKRHNPTQPT